MIPLRDENPSRSAPFITRALIAINAVAFVYELSLGPELKSLMFQWGLVPERLSASLQSGSEPLAAVAITFLTSAFLHGGWMHLIGNMWYLAIFGDNIEDIMGHGRFLAFYLVSAIVAGLVHYLANAHSGVPTVGASGAIAAVLGAYAVAFPKARVVTLIPIVIFFRILALPALLVLGLWFVLQAFSGALSVAGGVGGEVAWWAHIGGFAFGAIMVNLLRRREPQGIGRWVTPRG